MERNTPPSDPPGILLLLNAPAKSFPVGLTEREDSERLLRPLNVQDVPLSVERYTPLSVEAAKSPPLESRASDRTVTPDNPTCVQVSPLSVERITPPTYKPPRIVLEGIATRLITKTLETPVGDHVSPPSVDFQIPE
jgi:hypothetical protein